MAINKIVYGDTTLIDLTNATATAADIASGKTAFSKEGILLTGTAAGSSYHKIDSKQFTVNITSTSAVSVGSLALGSDIWDSSKILYIKVRDDAGPRNGYFTSSDSWILNYLAASSSSYTLGVGVTLYTRKTSTSIATRAAAMADAYGIFPRSLTPSGGLAIFGRYNSSYTGTINGTYTVEVYFVDYAPNTGNPFNF